MPAYLASLSYQNPEQADNALAHYVTGTDFFAYLRSDPVRLARFNSAMQGTAKQPSSSVTSVLVESSADTDGAVVMAGVGGGLGQVMEKVMDEKPKVKGHFVLQGQGLIFTQARCKSPHPRYDVMEYDFFTPQSVQSMFIHICICLPVFTSCAVSCMISQTPSAA